ncbi:IF4E-domain-containing protein [Myriangium duriaei CBS 260.36]|uniref:IF4E-domain-containing protein n=1 Tax=Myriangium duriaei CBS 260.36 TaxID=1168546 RepID=A0A9P4J6Z3_9PEZI|nr:IF4E-domain-containing protein [Myriangium duriaei CBS 260.36]
MDRDRENLWSRRANASKLSLSMDKTDRHDSKDGAPPGPRRFGSTSGKANPSNSNTPVTSSSVASPTSGASSAFGLGSGAFASFGSATKTPKTPGTAFDWSKAALTTPTGPATADKKEAEKEEKRTVPRRSVSYLKSGSTSSPVADLGSGTPKTLDAPWPLKYSWVVWYRPPTSKNTDYEKSMKALCKMHTAQHFWQVYVHMKRPSSLPTVSDYHFFKDGIRPVWEDEENKKGGKWIMRLKKGVADRYWEDLLLAMIGDQFAEAGEEVCGAVVSVRSGEDVFSIWTKNDGGRNVKIRETIKRVLALPPDTHITWKSHDDSITQKSAIDQARQERSQLHSEKRRNTLADEKQSAI